MHIFSGFQKEVHDTANYVFVYFRGYYETTILNHLNLQGLVSCMNSFYDTKSMSDEKHIWLHGSCYSHALVTDGLKNAKKEKQRIEVAKVRDLTKTSNSPYCYVTLNGDCLSIPEKEHLNFPIALSQIPPTLLLYQMAICCQFIRGSIQIFPLR